LTHNGTAIGVKEPMITALSATISASRSVVSGVYSVSLSTTQLPVVSTRPSFHAAVSGRG
jgi:K+ transporter